MFLPFHLIFSQYDSYDNAVRRELYNQTLLFVFRITSNKAYCDFLKATGADVMPAEVRTWVRTHVLEDGYLMLNVKHWLYHCVANDLDAAKSASKFGIDSAHVKLGNLLQGRLLRGLTEYVNTGYVALDIHTTQLLTARVWFRNNEAITKFCWRKLKFVSQQQGEEVKNTIKDLMAEGVRALRHTWPCYPSELYCDNLFKRTAHNYGMNIIDKMTTEKHARLVRDGDGFTNLSVSLEAAQIGAETAIDPNLIADLTGTVGGHGQEHVDLKLSIERYMEDLSPKKKQVMLSLGNYIPEFTEWLVDHHYVDAREDNEHLRARAPLDWYTKLAAKWLQVEHAKVVQFVNGLRQDFSAYA